MKKLVWLLVLVVFSQLVLAEVRINEVMYAPTSDWGGQYNEWIELYSENEINLSNWKIDGNDFDDIIIGSGGYVVIARNAVAFQNTYGFQVADGNFVLSNDGDVIELSNGTKSWLFPYDNNKANNNGKTLECAGGECTGGNWEDSLVLGGTPCEINSKAGFIQDYSQVKINEFLPDPIGNDDADKPLGEWVELYNTGKAPIDLRGLVLYDKDDSHELYISDVTTTAGTVIPAGSYLVVYRNGDTDFALNNDGFEEVRFYDGYPVNNSNLIDSMSYSGGVEGMSWSKVKEGWYKSTATLGGENVRVDGCDWSVKVLPRNSIFNSGQGLVWDVVVERNYGETGNLTVEGRVEDVFGKVVKTYKPWTDKVITTTRTKTYTPNLPEDIYKIFFEIKEIDCQDNDLSNNVDFDLVVINPQYKVFDSNLEIEEIYLGNDDEAEWGDRVRVKVHIYKGDETKYNVELYAEKDGRIVSKRTKTSVFDKFKDYTLTLPVQLEPNCNQYYLDGDYEMVLKGLEKEVREGFRIKGIDKELCQEVSGSVSGSSQKFGYKLVESPDEVQAGGDFDVKVELTGDDEEHDIKVKSYIYRGPKHYSEEVIEELKLEVNEIRVIDLNLEVDEDVKEGEYKLKIKINKDNQKTDKEITEEIKVRETDEDEECMVVGEELSVRNISINEKLSLLRRLNEDGKIVYLSKSKQSFEWVPMMIIGVLVLLLVILICKKL
ncbi:MAG: lamin tail domain-containing protein [Nanoarchaeota archaeon]|nr:lamin tail domain-containing protein [Nanoarchaeota archaeon]